MDVADREAASKLGILVSGLLPLAGALDDQENDS
jgi:hypothetical protein